MPVLSFLGPHKNVILLYPKSLGTLSMVVMIQAVRQRALLHAPLGYQLMSYFPMFHFRRRNAKEVINERSIIINILGRCNTRTLRTQLNWASKTF